MTYAVTQRKEFQNYLWSEYKVDWSKMNKEQHAD